MNKYIHQLDAIEGVSSGNAAFPSLPANDDKSITPFPLYSNRHGSSATINDNKTVKITIQLASRNIVMRRVVFPTNQINRK